MRPRTKRTTGGVHELDSGSPAREKSDRATTRRQKPRSVDYQTVLDDLKARFGDKRLLTPEDIAAVAGDFQARAPRESEYPIGPAGHLRFPFLRRLVVSE